MRHKAMARSGLADSRPTLGTLEENVNRRRRIGATTVICAALAVLAPQAAAHHNLNYTFTATPSTANSVADITSYVSFGAHIPASGTIHLPPGSLLAHANDSTSPVSPSPQHGDVVGTIAASSDLWTNGCGGDENQSYTLSWVEPIGSGAPSGTVAELKASGSFFGLTINKRVFFVKTGSGGDSYIGSTHYDMVSNDYPDEITCSTSTPEMTITGYGYARSGGVPTSRIVGKNPGAGTVTSHYHFTDTASATHSDSDSQTFS